MAEKQYSDWGKDAIRDWGIRLLMDFDVLKEQVKSFALTIGVSKIGFTDAEPLTEHLPLLEQRQKGEYRHALREGSPVKRISPQQHLPEAKSVLSVAVAYPGRERITEELSLLRHGPAKSIPARGRFSFISRGPDYHAVVRDKLEKIRQFILALLPEAKILIMVDKEEILEKAIAVKAGLGWFGRHTLLVTPEYGSLVSLGELVTDIPFPVDMPSEAGCGSCRACIDACPTEALKGDEYLNPDRCLAGISQSKVLPDHDLRVAMGTSLYGCDICQLVCPYNRQAPDSVTQEHMGFHEEAFPILSEVLEMSNSQFRARFGHTAGAWKGRGPIQRNAVIAAGNMKDVQSLPGLIRILSSDHRAVLRGAAAWALGRIRTRECRKALELAVDTEKDPDVLAEIKKGLERFTGEST